MSKATEDQRKCRLCGAEFSADLSQCTWCKAWHPPVRDESDDATVLLSDVDASAVERLVTGPWDENFGGGLAITGVHLIGGGPGAGKSTLSLQIADAIAEKLSDTIQRDREILIIGAEETVAEIKARAQRLSLSRLNRLRVLPIGNLDQFRRVVTTRRPAAVFLDSLQGFTQDLAEGIEICRNLKAYAMDLNAPMVVISQVNKNLDFAGLMALQHAVDATYTIVNDGDEDSPVRVFSTVKNRYGKAPLDRFYMMTPTGLTYVGDAKELEAYLENPPPPPKAGRSSKKPEPSARKPPSRLKGAK